MLLLLTSMNLPKGLLLLIFFPFLLTGPLLLPADPVALLGSPPQLDFSNAHALLHNSILVLPVAPAAL